LVEENRMEVLVTGCDSHVSLAVLRSLPAREDDPAWGLYRFQRDFGATIVSQPSGTKTISPAGAALNRVLLTLRRALKGGRT
jgi:hypothetical protein